MICFLFVWACLLLMLVTGIIISKLFKVESKFFNHKGLLVLPSAGIIFLMCYIELFNLFIPIKWLVYPYIFFIAYGIAKYKDSILGYLKLLFSSKRFLIIITLITLVWLFPLLGKSELASFQIWNNDIIYYLANMEWLQEHASTGKVIYDNSHPLYWCAQYMLDRTRIGFDGYGAFIMSLWGLRAHEIFSCLGILFGITLLFNTYYFLSTVCTVPAEYKLVIIIIIAMAGRIDELLIYQYIPQLCGISFFLLFLSIAFTFFEESDCFKHGLLAFVLSGIITVYAEFSSYIAVIYLTAIFIAYKKGFKGILKRGFTEGVIALLINPAAVWRAVKLNLFVLINAHKNMLNIDPFYGEISSITDAIAQMTGFCQLKELFSFLSFPYTVLFLCSILGIGFIWLHYIFKTDDEKKPYYLSVIVFWIIYDLYFRIIKYGYGEYKHLISATAMIITFNGYVGYRFINGCKKPLVGKLLYYSLGIFLLFCGFTKIYSNLIQSKPYYYDNSLMELSDAGHLIDSNDVIGISGSPATVHGAVYALNDRPAIILSNNTSYIPYSSEASSRFQLFEGAHDSEKENECFVWGNDRFYIIENTNMQSAFYTGFHVPSDETLYTCDKESSVMVYNYSEDTKYFSAAFSTQDLSDENSTIFLMLNGKTIAQGKAGDYIMTDMLSLAPNESLRIYIYYDGELTKQEDKTVGFALKDWKLVIYENE